MLHFSLLHSHLVVFAMASFASQDAWSSSNACTFILSVDNCFNWFN